MKSRVWMHRHPNDDLSESTGKPCPEKTRAHKTRCDAYFKCTPLSAPSMTHVWVPLNCKKGLVFEQSLGTCVLPGEDWECLPNGQHSQQPQQEQQHQNLKFNQLDGYDKNVDIDIVSIPQETDSLPNQRQPDDGNVEIVLDSRLSSEEEDDDDDEMQIDHVQHDDSNNNSGKGQYDSSGDGELVELDGFLQAESHKTELAEKHDKHIVEEKPARKEAIEELATELKQVNDLPLATSASPVDPNLTAYLQRLSQLIDGLKQTYQASDEKQQTELRPDQLNAFLAHFNIKNQFDAVNPGSDVKSAKVPASTTAASNKSTKTSTLSPVSLHMMNHLPVPAFNKTRLQEHLSLSNKLEPETKVELASMWPKVYGEHGHDYSNSQIVVNRPEGAVLFTLPNYGDKHYMEAQLPLQQQQLQLQQQPQHQSNQHDLGEPKISEETLKTVLELSKQMIAAQNAPKVISNPAFYAPPILQPVILTQAPQSHPFSAFFNSPNANYVMPQQQQNYKNKHHGHKKTHSPTSNDGYDKPSTMIIHNNVIPLHVSTTNSGEKEVIDTYGNSLGVYPPLHNSNDNNKNYDISTARPVYAATPSAPNYADQYPTPNRHEFALTTPSPLAHQPTSETLANLYTSSPHLNEHNVNRIFQTGSYGSDKAGNMPKPFDLNLPNRNLANPSASTYGIYPGTIDMNKVKMRPNSQKIESMEIDADEVINANAYNAPAAPQILTYSGATNNNNNNDATSSDLSGQLAHQYGSLYLEHALKQPYISMPTANTYSYDANGSSTNNNNNNYNVDFNGNQYGALSVNTKHTNSASNNINNNNNNSNRPNKYINGNTHMNTDNAQLVNFNGNFISLDVFQNSILPLISQSNAINELNNVEVITCQAGVRQPNNTDCTRYFVCSKKDGKVLSYSCPPYTGFNEQTRICDAQTYAQCTPVPVVLTYSVSENKRIHLEALRALQEAKKRQEAALKAQSMANLLQQYSNTMNVNTPSHDESTAEQDMLSSYVQQAQAMSHVHSYISTSSTTTSRPNVSPTLKKRKYYCKEGDKIPDQTSISNYFVCYKNAQGQMKGHKMTCSKGLLFCPRTIMCTLPTKCS